MAGDIDNERVAFPFPTRIAHPEFQLGRGGFAREVDQTIDLRPFESNGDMLFGLENLKRIIQVHDSRDTRHEAFLQRVESFDLQSSAVASWPHPAGMESGFLRRRSFQALKSDPA